MTLPAVQRKLALAFVAFFAVRPIDVVALLVP